MRSVFLGRQQLFLMTGLLYFLVTGALIALGVQIQIRRAARFLEQAFEQAYVDYRQHVGRYFGRSGRADP